MELGLGHLADGVVGGFMAGRRIKREDERAVQDTEERGLRMDAMRTQNANQAEDRTLRLGDDAIRRQQESEDRSYAMGQRERSLAEQQTKDGLRDFFRKVSPLVEAGQDDAAMEVIGQEYKNNPIFADGHYAEADKDEKGAFIKDKDGNYSVSYFTEDGKPTGQKRAVKPEQALVSMLDYFDPEEAIKRKQSAAAESAKDAREHGQKKELEGMKLSGEKENIRLRGEEDRKTEKVKGEEKAKENGFDGSAKNPVISGPYRDVFNVIDEKGNPVIDPTTFRPIADMNKFSEFQKWASEQGINPNNGAVAKWVSQGRPAPGAKPQPSPSTDKRPPLSSFGG